MTSTAHHFALGQSEKSKNTTSSVLKWSTSVWYSNGLGFGRSSEIQTFCLVSLVTWLLPFKYWTAQCLVLEWIQYSGVWFTDGYCTLNENDFHIFLCNHHLMFYDSTSITYKDLNCNHFQLFSITLYIFWGFIKSFFVFRSNSFFKIFMFAVLFIR